MGRCCPLRAEAAARAGPEGVAGGIPEGRRNVALTSVAGALRRQGLEPAAIARALAALNETICDPPLSEREVEAIARGMGRYKPEIDEPAEPLAPVLVRLADIIPERFRWLWPGRVPLGKLTIVEGDPGLGKSLLTLDLAARVTGGALMPDGAVSDIDGARGWCCLPARTTQGTQSAPGLTRRGRIARGSYCSGPSATRELARGCPRSEILTLSRGRSTSSMPPWSSSTR